MNRRTTIGIIVIMIAAGLTLGLVTSVIQPGPVHQDREPVPPPSDILVTAKMIIVFVNLFLVLSLLMIYLDIYRSVKSRFTIGLIFAILALLVYAITSNPIIQMALGYPVSGPGPFLFIPDIFTALAASVLIYLSIE